MPSLDAVWHGALGPFTQKKLEGGRGDGFEARDLHQKRASLRSGLQRGHVGGIPVPREGARVDTGNPFGPGTLCWVLGLSLQALGFRL